MQGFCSGLTAAPLDDGFSEYLQIVSEWIGVPMVTLDDL